MTAILEDMSPAPVSPVFVGRETELAVLAEAYETAGEGTPTTVLLGGEAGVGKTRLVTEFAARMHETGKVRVLVGGCLELSSAGLPYAPFTAALRQLLREIGPAKLAELIPGGSGRVLARLLPGLGEPQGADSDSDLDTGRLRLFEQMLTLLERLAEREPLVFVVEDAHWADHSTRDLLSFLVRNLRHGPVLLVITYRSDELHRTHPLRSLLAELSRVASVTRTDLPRLTRGEVAAQLGGILGRPADPALVSDVYGRSSGVPLFVEATATGDGPSNGAFHTSSGAKGVVPASLRDLLMASVQRLPEETQDVLRVASAGGDHVDHGLLAAVTGLDDRLLTSALRSAVDANVLIADADGYAFRHALIREAVHEDLLPGEHSRTHRRFAEVLEKSPDLSRDRSPSAALALHWSAAHDHERALVANWRAAADSAAALAYAEQLHMLEWVLELWDRVPNAAELVGTDQVAVMELAVDAAVACGEPDRGLAFVRAALAELDEAREPERVAVLLMRRAKLHVQRGLPGEFDALGRAERLAVEPTSVRARVLTRLAIHHMLASRDNEARATGREALELARRLGDEETELEVSITLACVDADDGDDITTSAESVRVLREVLAKAERVGDGWLVLRATVNLSHVLEGGGEHDLAIDVARKGFEVSKRVGRARTDGPYLATNLAESFISAGRWDEAETILDEALSLNPPASFYSHLMLYRGEVAVARGDAATTAQAIAAMPVLSPADAPIAQDVMPNIQLRIALRASEGDVSGALDQVDRAVQILEKVRPPRYAWPTLMTAMQACATVAGDAGAARDERLAVRAAGLRATLRTMAERVPAKGPVSTAFATTFAAESARADGVLDRAAWDAAAAAWDEIGRPYPLACALTRAAEAAAGDGDRDGAAGLLGRAAELADRLGAGPLRTQIDQLARRARIGIATPDAQQAPATLGLTPRELEVLRHVANGRSNREIAEALFISAKTASVHVSNILGKLDAASRGEAAATAHRLGLTDNT
jgi:ATP/maltotriose-dependent transcriptional regulator MalT